MNKIILTLLAATLPGVAAANPADDVRCSEIGFSLSAEHGDSAAFRRYIDADARFVGATVLRGPDAIIEAWRPFLEPGGATIRWRPRFVEVLEDGSLALTRGPYRVTSKTNAGDVVEQWGTFNSVWRLHEDGNWRVVFDAGSPGGDSPGETDEALLAAPTDCPTPDDAGDGSS